MAIVDTTPQPYDVPHEQGAVFFLRKLPWTQLSHAREIAEKKQRQSLRDIGPSIMETFTTGNKSDDKEALDRIDDAQQYRASNFDAAALLEFSIDAWEGPTYDDVEVSKKNISNLDPRTVDWCAQKVIDITRPPSEEDAKN